AVAAASTALRLGARLVDDQVAIAEETAVQHLDGLRRFLLGGHLDEPEAAGTSRELVGDDADRLDGAGLLEELTEVFFRGLEGKVPDEELSGHRAPPCRYTVGLIGALPSTRPSPARVVTAGNACQDASRHPV